jgi:hypothetical protein
MVYSPWSPVPVEPMPLLLNLKPIFEVSCGEGNDPKGSTLTAGGCDFLI